MEKKDPTRLQFAKGCGIPPFVPLVQTTATVDLPTQTFQIEQ